MKKDVKQPKTVMLKPINIAWLKKRALEESTPEDRVSDSAFLDQLIDQAREREETPIPSQKKRTAAPAVELAIAL